MRRYNDNPFYDLVLAWSGWPIPSTRSGYKNLATGGIVPNPETSSIHIFRKTVREAFRKYPQFKKPINGRVLISLAIGLTQKEYQSRDIDNMVKSVLDALKTVVYYDDRQVDVLHVVKYESDFEIWNIGIRKLRKKDPIWHFPQLYWESPY
jgi:Holliday junction resolvase RusA-like endonuclease